MAAPSSENQSIAGKMRAAGQSEPAIRAFLQSVERVRAGEQGLWREAGIEPVAGLPSLADLPPVPSGRAPWEQLAVIKLNGGLGTTMGLRGAKSLLEVKNGHCFLDFIARQILHCRAGRPAPQFYLMNSFSTRADTLAHLRRYPELAAGQDRLDFLQSQAPKLWADSLAPAVWPADPALEWCPPGHGEIYRVLWESSLLRQFQDAGVEFLFVSNADNLGACADPALLSWFAGSEHDFVMEVTARLKVDEKGGHLARRRGQPGLLLRESAQCPAADRASFENIQLHRYFNTNNLWIRVSALLELLERHDGFLPLPLIINHKPVDPEQPGSPPVRQLESAMGAAIELFDRATALAVPRARFAPVKNTNDLLGVRSDACVITADARLVLDPARGGAPPEIELDPRYYKLMADFDRAFPHGPPSLVACQRLAVHGPLVFAAGVRCEGEVIFRNQDEAPKTVPAGIYRDQDVTL